MKTMHNVMKRIMKAAAFTLVVGGLIMATKLDVSAETLTVKSSNVNVRDKASSSGSLVGTVTTGDKFDLGTEVVGDDGKTWYQIVINGQVGFIRSDFASKGSAAAAETKPAESKPAEAKPAENKPEPTETAATVTSSNIAKVKVVGDSVNVRKGPASTDAAIGKAKKGDTFDVSGEAVGADGKTWYQISLGGKTGFIREDLVKEDAEEAPAENEENEEGEGEEEGEAEEPEEVEEEPAGDGAVISNVISSRVLPSGAKIEDMTIDEATLASWESGNYYVLYTKEEDGSDGWYLYSLSDNQFEKINSLRPTGDGEEEEKSDSSSLLAGKNKIVVIVLAAVLLILLIVCIVLAVKLRHYKEYYEDDEDDEDDDDEDDDEDEDEDDEDDDEDDEDDDDEDDEDERPRRRGKKPVKKAKRSFSPKNFLSRYDDEDEDEEEDDEDDEDEDVSDDEFIDDDDFEFEFLDMDDRPKKKRR